MFEKNFETLVDVWVEKGECETTEKEIIVYGLSSAVEICFNIITTLIIGSVFGLMMEGVVFLISYAFLRVYAGGYHCKNAINCYFLSSGIIVAVLAIVKFTPKDYILVSGIMMLLISVPIILKLAPVETPTKPLDWIEKKHFRRRAIVHLFVECIAVIALFLLELNNFVYVICLGIAISAILASLGYGVLMDELKK